MKNSEISNLYNSVNKESCFYELNSIDKTMLDNSKIFEKINIKVKDILIYLDKFKKNKDFMDILKNYNKINKKDYSSLFLSKIIILSLNDVDKNRNTSEADEDSFLRRKSDVINFIKEKIYFLYIYMISLDNTNSLSGSQNEIRNSIEFAVFKMIQILCDNKIIKTKNIQINKTKTEIFVEIPELINSFKISLYTEKFSILKNLDNLDLVSNFIINSTIFSIYEINKVSGKSGSQFRIGETSFIDEINTIKVDIDIKIFKEIFTNYCETCKIDKKNIEEYYYKYKEDLKKCMYEKNKVAIKLITLKLSKYHKALIFLNIIKIIEERKISSFYLPFIMDFRGRIYKLSSISPTFFKEIRYSFSFEKKVEKKKIENDIKEIEKKINKIIYKYEYKLKKLEYIELNHNMGKKEKISIIWVLISLGQVFKKELGSIVNIEEFIDKAIEKINNLYEDNSIYKSEIIYYSQIINEIIDKNESRKLISKDATASVYQHLIKILDGKDEESYKFCNLTDPENWYDTYSMIIEKWKKEEKENYENNKDIINDIFTRDNLKKTLMTENYGCGITKCWEYFKLISKTNENKNIKKIFLNFYKYITNQGFFKYNSDAIINKLSEKKGILTNNIDKSEADIRYRKMRETRLNTTSNKRRGTMTVTRFLNSEDDDSFLLDKFKISAKANTVHFIDSSVVREILKRIRCIAIHDCFMVEPHKISRLIAIANYVMNMDFAKLDINKSEIKIFSIFILL